MVVTQNPRVWMWFPWQQLSKAGNFIEGGKKSIKFEKEEARHRKNSHGEHELNTKRWSQSERWSSINEPQKRHLQTIKGTGVAVHQGAHLTVDSHYPLMEPGPSTARGDQVWVMIFSLRGPIIPLWSVQGGGGPSTVWQSDWFVKSIPNSQSHETTGLFSSWSHWCPVPPGWWCPWYCARSFGRDCSMMVMQPVVRKKWVLENMLSQFDRPRL